MSEEANENKLDNVELNDNQIENNDVEEQVQHQANSINEVPNNEDLKSPPESSSITNTNNVINNNLAHQSTTSVNSFGNNPSTMLLSSSLDSLSQTKDGKKSPMIECINKAKDSLSSNQPDLLIIFEPLRLGCYNKSTLAQSIDSISKLVGSSLFKNVNLFDENNNFKSSLADKITETVCDCYSTNNFIDDQTTLQIVKALLAIVLYNNPSSQSTNKIGLVHHSTLLSAIRTVHEIFKYSKDQGNQMIAQAGLTQMVNAIFSRLRSIYPVESNESYSSNSSTKDTPTILTNNQSTSNVQKSTENLNENVEDKEFSGDVSVISDNPQKSSLEDDDDEKPSIPAESEKMTLKNFEGRRSFDAATPTNQLADPLNPPTEIMSDEELLTKDAFLVFRALCKLNMKSLHKDSEKEIRSPEFRSRLLSLHLIKTILNTHISVFLDNRIVLHSSTSKEPTQFFHAIKQYLCLSLSRNAPSSIPQLFELCCQIFSRLLESMRMKMKVCKSFILKILLFIKEKNSNINNREKLK